MMTWAYGKHGWYIACNGVWHWYAKHLENLGYRVIVSCEKPTA